MNRNELGSWAPLLQEYLCSSDWETLRERVEQTYAESQVFPPREALFTALQLTPPERVRVVILGQDPYHEPGQAHGLAFSVKEGTRLPPSLVNIYKELYADLGIPPARSGNLSRWAEQGVLLLNTVLTVESGRANSHAALGWQLFTDAVFRAAASLPRPVVFVLWGAPAQKKEPLISSGAGQRLVLKAPHPSPLSAYRGFFGSKPFSQINRFLRENGEPPIDWGIE